MSDTKRFDQAAATWDSNELRVALSRAVAHAISTQIPLSKEQSVLDFGCGTGLVTLELAPQVGTITAADTSSGMLQTLEKKATAKSMPIRLLPLNQERTTDLGGPYHLIVSSMTLHHVADVPALFRQFEQHLLADGQVALADLDEEDGTFHEDMTGVYHQGFSRTQIQAWLESAGFSQVQLHDAGAMHKEKGDYSIFLATARKVSSSR